MPPLQPWRKVWAAFSMHGEMCFLQWRDSNANCAFKQVMLQCRYKTEPRSSCKLRFYSDTECTLLQVADCAKLCQTVPIFMQMQTVPSNGGSVISEIPPPNC